MNNNNNIQSREQLFGEIKRGLTKLGFSSNVYVKIKKMNPDILATTKFKFNPRIGRNLSEKIIFNSLLIGESKLTVLNLLAHEAAHYTCGFYNDHNKLWRSTAEKYSRILECGKVSQWCNHSDNSLSANFHFRNYKYVYRCSHCGKLIGFNEERYGHRNLSHAQCNAPLIELK